MMRWWLLPIYILWMGARSLLLNTDAPADVVPVRKQPCFHVILRRVWYESSIGCSARKRCLGICGALEVWEYINKANDSLCTPTKLKL